MQNQIRQEHIDKADRLMREKYPLRTQLTTTKLRNILSKVQDLYHEVRLSRENVLTEEQMGQILYLKIRLVYECGREQNINAFVQEAGIMKLLDDIGNDKAKYMELCHYLEALVAYHRYYGGKD